MNKPYSQDYALCLCLKNINILSEGSVPKHWTWFFLKQLGKKLKERISITQDKQFTVAKSS